MTKILVTGGFGFIGSNFIRLMLRSTNDVSIINIDKMGPGSDRRNLAGINRRKLQNSTGNISNQKLLRKLINGIDSVVHIAAETHVDRSIKDPRSFFNNNTRGSFLLLETLRKYNDAAKMVQISTDEVYGEASSSSFSESDAINPSNPYSASKAGADALALSFARTYGMNISITRCTNNFGPYQSPEKFIPKCIISSILNERIPVYGKGKNIRDWLFVDDHCEAISLVLKRGSKGAVYNISAGNEYANISVVERILDLMKKPKSLIEFVEDRPGHDKKYSLNSEKIRKQLGWKPKNEFHEALLRTVEWYQKNFEWWRSKAESYLAKEPWRD